MKFLVDNQLPLALAQFLSSRGFPAEHVLHLKIDEASDVVIWNYASANQMVMISKDEDFVYLATASDTKCQLVWVRLGNCRNEDLFTTFDAALPQITAALEQGHSVVEIC